ncbi:MAG TPA: tetratricopeptide repeat protein [Chthoniobacteraceae bacterium]|nr:tetratricopeptide repeat protein [Chthoniobacteraceae bacterium]
MAAALPQPARAVQESGPSEAARQAGIPYMRALETAAAAFANRQFDQALQKLDEADEIQQNIPDTWDMRGAIYAEQHDFDKARDAFQKAAKLDPRDFWPPYNLAQLLLMQRKYAEAAAEFKALVPYKGHEELVRFKIVFADLLAGKADDARVVLDAMKFPSDSPAYYFAHASWSFSHKNQKDGFYWIQSAVKIFGDRECYSYYNALAGEGWVAPRLADGSIPTKQDLNSLPTLQDSDQPAASPGSIAPAGPLTPRGL